MPALPRRFLRFCPTRVKTLDALGLHAFFTALRVNACRAGYAMHGGENPYTFRHDGPADSAEPKSSALLIITHFGVEPLGSIISVSPCNGATLTGLAERDRSFPTR